MPGIYTLTYNPVKAARGDISIPISQEQKLRLGKINLRKFTGLATWGSNPHHGAAPVLAATYGLDISNLHVQRITWGSCKVLILEVWGRA